MKNTKTALKGWTKPLNSLKEWIKSHRLYVALGVASIMFATSAVAVYLDTVVTTEVIETEEAIAFKTEYEDDSNLELRVEQVKQNGEDGVKKVFTEKKKRLLSGKEISSKIVKTEIAKEPVAKIILQGTRRWQYMYCSNGGARYFTDEQFKNKYIGFTHASEDSCETNNMGKMVALADTPNYANLLTQEQQRQLALQQAEYDEWTRRSLEERQQSSKEFLDAWQADVDANNARFEAAMQKINQDLQQGTSGGSESACRDKANRAGQNFQRALGAQGAGGSSTAIYGVQQVIDSTYQACMNGS